MRYLRNIRPVAGLVVLALLVSGCAFTSSYQALDPTYLQQTHQTEIVLLTHPPLKYYWEIQGSQGYRLVEVRWDQIGEQSTTWQDKQIYELGLVEAYLARLEFAPEVTEEIYLETFQRATAGSPFMLLSPYSGPGSVNSFEQIATGELQLPYRIPSAEDTTPPDWYLILDVHDAGLIKKGMAQMGGPYYATTPIELFSAIVADAIVTGLINVFSKKTWLAYFNGDMIISDAQTGIVLWKSRSRGTVEIQGKLEHLVSNPPEAFAGALAAAIAQAAVLSAVSLRINQEVTEPDMRSDFYVLNQEELQPFISRLVKAEQTTNDLPD